MGEKKETDYHVKKGKERREKQTEKKSRQTVR